MSRSRKRSITITPAQTRLYRDIAMNGFIWVTLKNKRSVAALERADLVDVKPDPAGQTFFMKATIR